MFRHLVLRLTCVTGLVTGAGNLVAQNDPGPRGGAAGAGGYFPSLKTVEQQLFATALAVFNEIDSVSGALAGENGTGLGPTFNGNSCAMCHAQPAVGGSSPGLASKQRPVPNPQVALATLDGANNTVPSFITNHGPVREARYISTINGNSSSPDGGVHGLYTIAGRTDARGCRLDQPDFATQMSNHNVIFRIPTPVFGLGLVENTADSTLQANLSSTAAARAQMNIGGMLNTTGNDGSVTRFGWKAQNKSLLIFSGEAYNVEMGVSNEVFPNERSAVAGCVFNSTPEDLTPVLPSADPYSDVQNFAIFSRLLAPPVATTSSGSEKNGMAQFAAVGCVLCHSPSLTTAAAKYTGMSNYTYHPYSDFAVHHMGSNLSDGITQGAAGPDQFRTAPLWGVGQRLFFLHDGRTSDLLEAIQDHVSSGSDCVGSNTQITADSLSASNRGCASEANAVIAKFNALTTSQKQDILNFLRSL